MWGAVVGSVNIIKGGMLTMMDGDGEKIGEWWQKKWGCMKKFCLVYLPGGVFCLTFVVSLLAGTGVGGAFAMAFFVSFLAGCAGAISVALYRWFLLGKW